MLIIEHSKYFKPVYFIEVSNDLKTIWVNNGVIVAYYNKCSKTIVPANKRLFAKFDKCRKKPEFELEEFKDGFREKFLLPQAMKVYSKTIPADFVLPFTNYKC